MGRLGDQRLPQPAPSDARHCDNAHLRHPFHSVCKKALHLRHECRFFLRCGQSNTVLTQRLAPQKRRSAFCRYLSSLRMHPCDRHAVFPRFMPYRIAARAFRNGTGIREQAPSSDGGSMRGHLIVYTDTGILRRRTERAFPEIPARIPAFRELPTGNRKRPALMGFLSHYRNRRYACCCVHMHTGTLLPRHRKEEACLQVLPVPGIP